MTVRVLATLALACLACAFGEQPQAEDRMLEGLMGKGKKQEEGPEGPLYEINPNFGFRTYHQIRYEPMTVPFDDYSYQQPYAAPPTYSAPPPYGPPPSYSAPPAYGPPPPYSAPPPYGGPSYDQPAPYGGQSYDQPQQPYAAQESYGSPTYEAGPSYSAPPPAYGGEPPYSGGQSYGEPQPYGASPPYVAPSYPAPPSYPSPPPYGGAPAYGGGQPYGQSYSYGGPGKYPQPLEFMFIQPLGTGGMTQLINNDAAAAGITPITLGGGVVAPAYGPGYGNSLITPVVAGSSVSEQKVPAPEQLSETKKSSWFGR